MNFYQEHHIALKREIQRLLPIIQDQIYEFGNDETLEKIYTSVEKAYEVSGLSKKTSCSKGCSFCCYDKILLSAIEQRTISKKIKKYNKKLINKQNTKDFDSLKWVEKKCSLLDNQGNCTIYEDRPLICRTHNSTGEPEDCKITGKGHQQAYILEVEAMEVALLASNQGEEMFLHELIYKLK